MERRSLTMKMEKFPRVSNPLNKWLRASFLNEVRLGPSLSVILHSTSLNRWKAKFLIEPSASYEKGDVQNVPFLGADRIRTGAYRFCRPVPYRLGTAPLH